MVFPILYFDFTMKCWNRDFPDLSDILRAALLVFWLEMNQLSHLQIGKLTLVKNNLWCISKRFVWSIAPHFSNHPPPNPMSETVNWPTTNSRTVWQKCRNSPIQLFCVSQFKSPQIKTDGLFMHFWWAGSILWQKRTNQNQFFSLTERNPRKN